MEEQAVIIGDRLRVLREEKQLSQGDIEKKMGLLRCYVSRVENRHTRTKGNGLIHAKSLQIDLIFSMFCKGCRANPLIQLMTDADSARPFSCAHFGIRHFFKRGNASEHRRRLHIDGVVEWQTKVPQ
jgi:hypothetical protein